MGIQRIWPMVLLLAAAPAACRAKEPVDVRPAAARAAAAMPRQTGADQAPVLLPADPTLRKTARVMQTGKAHTVSIQADGIMLEITGLPASGPAPLAVTRTEYGFDASFGRGGGLYNLTVTCDRPSDPRCADERFIRGLVAGLSPR